MNPTAQAFNARLNALSEEQQAQMRSIVTVLLESIENPHLQSVFICEVPHVNTSVRQTLVYYIGGDTLISNAMIVDLATRMVEADMESASHAHH